MVGEPERCGIVVNLSDVITLPQHTITPSGNTCFLGCVVGVCSKVILVCRRESDAGLRVVREGQASNHLEVELQEVSEGPKSSAATYLIVIVQGLEIIHLTQPLDLVITQTNPVVEVAQPDHSIVILD